MKHASGEISTTLQRIRIKVMQREVCGQVMTEPEKEHKHEN
jgi:hypothetical protein